MATQRLRPALFFVLFCIQTEPSIDVKALAIMNFPGKMDGSGVGKQTWLRLWQFAVSKFAGGP